MRFEQTIDADVILGFVANPAILARITGTSKQRVTERDIDMAINVLGFVVCRIEGAPVALFVINPLTEDSAEVHFAFSPSEWGRTAPIARGFVEWLWSHSNARTLIGPVPAYNRLALRLAKAAGFSEYRREHNAVKHNGKGYDLIRTSLERPAA